MTNELTIQHINQIIEIKYTDPEWKTAHISAGTLEGFNTDGSTYEWWMAGNDARYTAATITVRTLDEIKNAWMQPGYGSTGSWPSWGEPAPNRKAAEDSAE
jgi:hypothetical protein